jgi:hypothetical protein
MLRMSLRFALSFMLRVIYASHVIALRAVICASRVIYASHVICHFVRVLRGRMESPIGGFQLRGCSAESFHPAGADGNLLPGVVYR